MDIHIHILMYTYEYTDICTEQCNLCSTVCFNSHKGQLIGKDCQNNSSWWRRSSAVVYDAKGGGQHKVGSVFLIHAKCWNGVEVSHKHWSIFLHWNTYIVYAYTQLYNNYIYYEISFPCCTRECILYQTHLKLDHSPILNIHADMNIVPNSQSCINQNIAWIKSATVPILSNYYSVYTFDNR